MRTLTIDKVNNGYILTSEDFLNDDYENDETTVVESNDENEGLIELLNIVAEWTGYTYDKFGTNNLKITMGNPGHKLET